MRIINLKNFIIFICLLLLSNINQSSQLHTAKIDISNNYSKFIADADKSRGHYDGLVWDVFVKGKKKERRYHVMVSKKAIVARVLLPKKYKNHRILITGGRMYYYKIGTHGLQHVTKAIKFNGEALFGDILSINYLKNYNIESVNNVVYNNKNCLFFKLKSNTKLNTYNEIHYWIDKEKHLGLKSVFFSTSGKKLKSAEMKYRHNIIDNNGKKRPIISSMLIIDHLYKDSLTHVEFSQPQLEKIPPHYFNLKTFHKEQ